MTAADPEFDAIQVAYAALAKLDPEAQARALSYVSARLGVAVTPKASTPIGPASGEDGTGGEGRAPAEAADPTHWTEFAELHNAADPSTTGEAALVAAYWLQVCGGAESFDSFSVNKEMKNLGQPLENVTYIMDTLKNQRPAPILQLRKSGKTRQARKTYKVTAAGIKLVEQMIAKRGA